MSTIHTDVLRRWGALPSSADQRLSVPMTAKEAASDTRGNRWRGKLPVSHRTAISSQK